MSPLPADISTELGPASHSKLGHALGGGGGLLVFAPCLGAQTNGPPRGLGDGQHWRQEQAEANPPPQKKKPWGGGGQWGPAARCPHCYPLPLLGGGGGAAAAYPAPKQPGDKQAGSPPSSSSSNGALCEACGGSPPGEGGGATGPPRPPEELGGGGQAQRQQAPLPSKAE